MASARPKPRRTVVPDRLDLRDRPYEPTVRSAPPSKLSTLDEVALAALDQKSTSACTGFGLARVVDILLSRANRAQEAPVSPFMLYSMARRYDEFRGYNADDGSSVRGALKGWYRHGACNSGLWTRLAMPPAQENPLHDWWQDATKRPLGAYYRVDSRSVTDMHVALAEVGVLYASAVCHSGWDEGFKPWTGQDWVIPIRKAADDDSGHAFAIVGYNERGFLVLNSWGRRWGAAGVGILTYDDWLDNAMDCWVAQLGVPTTLHQEVAQAKSLRVDKKHKVLLAKEETLRNRELSPFIVDVQNNGQLSDNGRFRTKPEDLKALVTIHLDEAIERWAIESPDPIDVAIYAHGGLVGEEEAATIAGRWIPPLYDARIFPVFVMWETDIFSTLANRLQDLLMPVVDPAERRTAGVRDQLQRWVNERLERAFAKPGSFCWTEMKQNADAMSLHQTSALQRLYREFATSARVAKNRVRLHLIGHSAGAIVHSHLAARLAGDGWTIESLVFMAPAVRVDTFDETVRPLLGKRVKRLAHFYLDDVTEQRDPTCRPLLGYGRSLLYLVSESFERGRHVPILGMERYFTELADMPAVTAFRSPGPKTESTTHGGFDNDAQTLASVIRFIKG